ncbi:hypothetical protein niasHT_015933 [Heterodera trifolii]|uniref:Integrase catalytic domain-containing protein n=1 Tax=Heterodera trifolii TaxID=157864 RepID=A0ABD2KYZ3_9BILA
MQHTKRYLLVPEDIYQSLTSPPPSDGTPIGLVRNRIKQIKNDDGINEAERAIKYAQELKRLNKLTKDEDERPVGVKLENLSDVVDAMPKPVNVRRPIVVATRRHLKVGRARKENVEQLEDDDDDHDHDHAHETPKPSSSNKRQPTQTEILKLIYKNAQSLGVSEEGQVLRAGGRPFITSSVYDIVSHLLNKDKRAQNKEPTAFKEFVERARQIPLLTIIMDLKKLRLLELLYKDLSSPVAFTSVESLLREARKSQRKISRTDVQNYLASQRTYTLHRQAKRRYRRLPTLASGLHTEWQADLAIFDRLGKQNRGYSYLLVCIDTLSRQVFVEPVKTKTSANMIIAFGRIFKRSKYIPWKVLTDQGKEFTARAVQQFFRTKDVEHFCMLTSPQFHAGMAERANRSIKERLYRYFTERNTYKWIDVVQDIVRAINHSPNSTIGMRPADVNFKNAEALRQKLHNAAENVVRRQPKYRVGDRVRIEKYKHVFQKGYLPRFTNELFTMAEEIGQILSEFELNSVAHGLLAREKRAETSNIALRIPADDNDSYQHKLDEYFSKLNDKNLSIIDELGMTKLNAEIKNLSEEERATLEATKEMGTEAWIQAYREIRLVCQFNYDVNKNRFVLNTDPRYVKKVEVSPQLAYILGFNNTEFMQAENEARFMPDMSGGVSSFHVYTPDLIEPMMIGDVTAPVLRIVTIRGNPDQVIEEQFFAIQYHKLLSKEVSEILIEIRTNSGSLMPFQYGTYQIPAGTIVKFPHCMVVNLDPSTSRGSHWVCIYCASPLLLEYYDSLGMWPPPSVLIVNHLSRYKQIQYSSLPLQSPNSSACGRHVIFFLYCRCVGMTFEKIVSFLHFGKQQPDTLPPVLDGPYPRAQDGNDFLEEDEAPVLLEVFDRLSQGEICRPVGPFSFALGDYLATFNTFAILFDCATPVPFDEEHKRYVFQHRDKPRLIYVSEDGSAIQVDGVVKQGEFVISIETMYLDKRNGVDHFCTFLRTFGICFLMCH